MLESAIYCKTHKGTDEIAHRTCHLASRLRSTLILIDGHTPWNELQKRLMIGREAQAAVETLLAEGYVQPVGHAPTPQIRD